MRVERVVPNALARERCAPRQSSVRSALIRLRQACAGQGTTRSTLMLGMMLVVGRVAAVELDVPVFAGGFGLDYYLNAARAFEAQRPGVRIRLYGDPRIWDKVRVRIIDGDYPDAAFVPYILWPALIRAGKILDLTPSLAGRNWEGDRIWADTFQPAALENWEIGGRIYGLPISYACWTLFYNKRLFREHGWDRPRLPRTWDEFFALCDRIRAAGVAPISVPGTHWLYADAFFRSAYFDLAGPSGWAAMNDLAPGARADPRYVRAAAIEQRVTRTDTLRGWEGATHTGAELAFFEGESAMTVSGSWLANEMAGKIPAGFELGAMNFPVFPGGVAEPTTIQTSSDCFFVFKTGHPDRERAAVDFLRFLTSRAEAADWVRRFDSPPAVKGVPVAAYSPFMRDTAEMVARAKAAFPMPQLMLQPAALRQALVDESDRLTQGRITPAEYGRRLEAAAAEDRAQRANPNRIEVRFPLRGILFLVILAFIACALLAAFLRKRTRRVVESAFPLRWSMASLFVLPSFLLYAALVLAPALTAFGWSLTRWDGIGHRSWAGLFHFKELLFGSEVFWTALGNNVFLMLVPALLVVPVALVAAALLHRGVWGSRAFQAIFLFPNLLGGVAAALLWMNAYEPRGGLVNAGLSALGRLLHSRALMAFDGFPWLASEHLYLALLPIYLWMACGFNLILYLAAMESIDPQLYEAAALDGASPIRQFFTITLPLIRDVLVVSAVFLVIAGLNAFELIWLLSEQQPTASNHTLATLLVTTMFMDMDIGRAAALAVILFLLVFTGSAVVMRLSRREAIEL
jgi:ABC-type sugar transport system permease subunit/ABC-type glycerol-3-phosphate transport system substrate-binding protein